MKDPVTTATGITYDRSSIERWLKEAVVNEPVCPVTKQPLPSQHLTPNHTLRRLIQGWCVANANRGVERIPTPKPVLCRAHVLKILRGLSVPRLQSASLDQLLSLISTTSEDEHAKDDDRKLMAECGVVKAMASLIITCYKDNKTTFLNEALRILTAVWVPANVSSEVRTIVSDNIDLVDAITWVLFDKNVQRRTHAVNLINEVVKVAGSSLVERLKPEFFKGVVAALRVLLEVCQHGRNRHRIIEANTIFHLIEIELELGLAQSEKNKKMSELIFCLLAQLCSCADGRAQFLAHSGGMAVVSKRILRVSAVVDDRAVHVFGLIAKFSATKEVLHEMLKVGAVSKLCMVLQADCAKYLKDKVREMLRMHASAWNNSPCIQVYLLTRYPMLQF
uniref:U-box domain-containing protein n=1 Tax=Chenopodium quinoa TaxID=63459 RepID=A0A803KR98_CHEQI